jgi:hypothetical protein
MQRILNDSNVDISSTYVIISRLRQVWGGFTNPFDGKKEGADLVWTIRHFKERR